MTDFELLVSKDIIRWFEHTFKRPVSSVGLATASKLYWENYFQGGKEMCGMEA